MKQGVGAPPPAPVRRNPARKRRSGGFPTPTLTGGLKVPPSYSRNSGPAGAQRRQPRRRGGQECPPSGGASFLRSPPPAGLRHDPARNWAGIVHQRGPPRCRCRTTRRGDPCGRPPPNGATVRRPLLGHYRTGGGVERRHSRGTMRPRRAPTRGAPTVIGNWKFQRRRRGDFPVPLLLPGR